jgi:hypothetical protein
MLEFLLDEAERLGVRHRAVEVARIRPIMVVFIAEAAVVPKLIQQVQRLLKGAPDPSPYRHHGSHDILSFHHSAPSLGILPIRRPDSLSK